MAQIGRISIWRKRSEKEARLTSDLRIVLRVIAIIFEADARRRCDSTSETCDIRKMHLVLVSEWCPEPSDAWVQGPPLFFQRVRLRGGASLHLGRVHVRGRIDIHVSRGVRAYSLSLALLLSLGFKCFVDVPHSLCKL